MTSWFVIRRLGIVNGASGGLLYISHRAHREHRGKEKEKQKK